MPGGDRTGPAGMGPMTGRAAGYCAGYSVPGYMNPYGGRVGFRGAGRGGIPWGGGRGRVWGGGRGMFGRGYMGYPPQAPYYANAPYYPPAYSAYDQPTVAEEKGILKEQLAAMKEEMGAMEKRLAEIEKEEKKK